MNQMELPLAESLYDSQGRNDALITLLVELCHLLSACLRRDQSAEAEMNGTGEATEESDSIDVPLQIDPYAQLAKTLGKLGKRPGHDGTVLVRACRLSSRAREEDSPEYRVYFSDICMDRDTVAGMIRRVGGHMTYLNALVFKAFETFARHNILSLFIKLPGADAQAFAPLRLSLKIIARYHQALAKASPISFADDGTQIALPIMKDEKGSPDPNLTLLAGLNQIPQEAMGTLVKEVRNWLKESEVSAGAHRYASVYDAIARVKNLRQKYLLPPIEMNSIRWLVADRAGAKLPKAKAQMARLIAEEFEKSQMDQALYLESLYGTDYHQIDARELGLRLKRVSDIIDAVGERPKKTMILDEVLFNLQWRMDRVPDAVMRALGVDKGVLRVRDELSAFEVGLVHDLIVRIVDFYSGRVDTRMKMRRIGSPELNFEHRDHEILARDFDLSPLDVKEIIGLLRKCFDAHGRFIKNGFEDSAEGILRHEEKVFEILWYFLKQPMAREDRINFLNALQLLFVKMQKPERALSVLLGDFLDEADEVRLSDRHAIMLCNLLLRRYNKELEIDIEITPEEVFLVREGLNREAAASALMCIDQDSAAWFEKIRSIHRKIIESLDFVGSTSEELGAKYLLSLEREVHIFVALLGGDIARSVLRSALNEYGNPDAEVYRQMDDSTRYESFLQHLKILFRAIGRAGDPSDLWLITQIAERREAFYALSQENRHAVIVDRVIDWAEKAKETIQSRRVADIA
jgi:hypothetical protein